MKQINGLVGFNHGTASFQKMDVVAEINTNRKDTAFSEQKETIGVARYNGTTVLFSCSPTDHGDDRKVATLILEDDNLRKTVASLRKLADELEKANE